MGCDLGDDVRHGYQLPVGGGPVGGVARLVVHAPMILNLISSHNSVTWHFRKQLGNLYMTAKSTFENSNLWEN